MGAASAADDVSIDAVDASVDDAVIADAVIDDTDDSTAVEETPVDAISDDIAAEEIDEETQTDEISEESAIVDSEPTRTTTKHVSNWADLEDYCEKNNDNYIIYLDNVITYGSDPITFKNSATIIGTPDNYITGGNSNKILFQSTGSLDISFINVTFKNMDASVLIKLATTGTNSFINCSFDNIHTYAYKSSVIWNDKGYMDIIGCNFTNCNDGFGAITNYATTGTVQMNVENSRFEDNYGRIEPGAINNCGELNVTDSTFIHNRAGQWAGAIHTHSNAHTRIVGSNFTDNVAGTNGGALFSYSKLEVINCAFTGNNATNNGGAICGYSYGSTYNITVQDSRFTNNKVSNGAGGAIRAMNLGYLTVCSSNFTHNSASNGQAISGITETIDYCNCWNCTCPNCPNCTNCTHYVSNESANLKICHNIFLNHTGSGDTVTISGNDYIFDYNIFINSTQNTHYNGTGNQYGLTNYPTPSPSPSPSLLTSNLRSSILGDSSSHDVIFVNESSSNDPRSDDITGQSWDDAFGTEDGFYKAVQRINDGGIIYLADCAFTWVDTIRDKSFTAIGFARDSTIISCEFAIGAHVDEGIHYAQTFINMTFINLGYWSNDVTFINCTFINFKTNEVINDGIDENTEYGVIPPEESYVTNFINCDFINSTISGENLIDIAKYTQINFNNCNFENIAADSIVSSLKGKFFTQDGINFRDCKFTNVTTKGIVSIPTGADILELVHIEGCTYDVPVTNDIITDGGRDYINNTQSRADSNLTMDIDGDNLVISLTDMEGNSIADVDEINVLVNEESIPCQMENGVATLNISDLSGKVTFSAAFEGNANYKESSASLSTYIIVNNITVEVPVEVPVYIPVNQTATSIVASALTTTAKIAKTLSITLKDASGKVLASKAIKVTVNGKTSTVTTDKNGIAKLNINYAKAGTYYYTLSFLGDNDYKASMKAVKVTVNKQATKATFAKKTFKVKAKTKKVTFTLKDAKGKAIKGKKITFTVNKKTYTAKTNAKGIATVKVKLTKKGKYTAIAKFAGDNTYKAISKKAVITIK